MLERKRNLKATKGIVSRRKPKKSGVTSKTGTESELRKFNLSLPKELFLQVVEAAAIKNVKINAFIANALRAELSVAIIPITPTQSEATGLKKFLDGMSAFDWAQALIQNEENRKNTDAS